MACQVVNFWVISCLMMKSKGNRKFYYLDNAASTPIDKKVATEMARATRLYGNPSSYNDCGRRARDHIEQTRLKVARFLGAHPDEIIFTGSGTEANNLAIQGIARLFQIPNAKPQTSSKHQDSKPHVITTQIEHPSVLKPIGWLEKIGFDATYLPVDKEGFIDPDELQKMLRPETVLVSVMYANNEIGTIQPIMKIGKIISDFRKSLQTRKIIGFPVFHVDACQAVEYLNTNVNHLGVDLFTFNGSKIYGPRGIGVLYKRRGIGLSPLVLGGEQEWGLRAGTENTAAISGLVVALGQIETHSTSSGQGKESKRLIGLRDYFIQRLRALLSDISINGPSFVKVLKGKASRNKRLPNNISISIPGLTSEALLLELDKYGICAGSGSACTSHSVEPSHVLKAIGLDKKYLDGALRFSMGRQTTKKELDFVLKVLPKIVKELRERYKK